MILKDELFNVNTVTILAKQIKQAYPDFKDQAFINESVASFPPLELKERMSSVQKKLDKYLPKNFVNAVDILSEALHSRKRAMFIYGAVLEYIEKNGCNDQYIDLSLEKLGELTSALSSEFAIRPFLNHYPDKSLMKVLEWAKSEDVHKRRLASEGTRPSLPWAMKISVNYKDASQVLDHLYYDTDRYVTRSVANHLNDISKIDPIHVLNLLKKWQTEKKQNKSEMDYIIKHSLRTLIKKGHRETLDFLGYKTNPMIEVSELLISSDEISIGDKLIFEFEIKALEDTNLIVDYIIIYPSKTKRPSSKTYKLTVINAKKNKSYSIKGTRSFANLSTRKMKVGLHEIHIQVNGNLLPKKTFNLR